MPSALAIPADGSSPHARGTSCNTAEADPCCRFIPTRAGNIVLHRPRQAQTPVHPHTRGEHSIILAAPRKTHGSSPHARGTSPGNRSQTSIPRFIPTRAGNIGSLVDWKLHPSVHPHTRGEHVNDSLRIRDPAGSSPHARGTSCRPLVALDVIRFIPTRAGNIRRAAAWAAGSPVHPHTRGEHAGAGPVRASFSGSSPHARGTSSSEYPPPTPSRFIPTRAGNIRAGPALYAPLAVHPHTRGEHSAT